MENLPPSILEQRAADERRRLESSVAELKSRVRETLDAKRIARQHLPAAAAVAGLLSLGLGYAVTGILTRH
jgi:hypothetical protein